MALAALFRPAVRDPWATGSSGPIDVVDPGNTYVDVGWPPNGPPPPRGIFNWVLNYCFNGVRFLCRRGICDWSVAENYMLGDITLGSDGSLYQSQIDNNAGTDPTIGGNVSWDTLNNYISVSQFTSMLNAALASYLTISSFASIISAYITTTAVNTLLGQYVKTTTLTATLSSYLTTASAAATYATLTQLALKAPTLSPSFTGDPQAPTPVTGDRSKAIATTQFVGAVAQVIAQAVAAPGASFGTRGWRQNADGSIDQWDTIANGDQGPTPVVFPIAFPNQCFGVTPSCVNVQGTLNTQNVSRTGCTLTNGAAGSSTYYVARGV